MMDKQTAMIAMSVALLACVSVAGQEHAVRKGRRAPDGLAEGEVLVVELYREVLPSVVTILTARRVATPIGASHERGLGTGVLISPECHVLTAAHVVSGVDEIVVKTQDGKLRPADLLFSEPGADLALLRLVEPDVSLRRPCSRSAPLPFPPATLTQQSEAGSARPNRR